jgi:hypothetical protein
MKLTNVVVARNLSLRNISIEVAACLNYAAICPVSVKFTHVCRFMLGLYTYRPVRLLLKWSQTGFLYAKGKIFAFLRAVDFDAIL